MRKQDELLLMIALSGEMPADLAGMVVGSVSYAAAVITRLKQEGYISVRNKAGYKGYVLRAKGKRYLISQYGEDTGFFLQGAVETNHVKTEVEKRLRLYRMSKVWVFLWKAGIPIFRSQKPELFCSVTELGRGQAAYYGSLEFKGLTDAVKGSRACGMMLSGESGYIVYHTLSQRMRWAKKMERSMRSFVERESMKAGVLKRIDAVIIGDTIEFLPELLNSDGGIKENLFRVDDIYDNYYYVPMLEAAKIQLLLLADKQKQKELHQFLSGVLVQKGNRECQVSAGTDESGNPVYFCYELEMRHLLRVKQELEWKRRGAVLCFSYQRPTLEEYFGKGVRYREILTTKVLEYLGGV